MNKAFLIILDGFGHSDKVEHNAVQLAETPYIDSLKKEFPHSLIKTDGEAVGLPEGIMGNSEVGHLSLGSGRKIYQDLTKISKYFSEDHIRNHKFFPTIEKSLGRIHLLGLISDGGVHSHIEHLESLVSQLLESSKQEIVIHMFSDGRDTSPSSGLGFATRLIRKFGDDPKVRIASVVGRFYAMDRDNRWDRVKQAYDLLSSGVSGSEEFSNLEDAISDAYSVDETDEFIKPRKTKEFVPIAANDTAIFFNFRSDRARELSTTFTDLAFSDFDRSLVLPADQWMTFTQYRSDFKFPVLFPKEQPKDILGEVISFQGGKQLRCAETEKYAHVTFFFNGGRDEPFTGEDRFIVDSPRDVATYDLKPEMSAPELTDRLKSELEKGKYDLAVVNYANGDMVGHSGNEKAAIKAVECLDKCLSSLVPAALGSGYEILITADHGNCEEMLNEETGKAFTQHSMNRVPLIWVGERAKLGSVKDGGLADIAPTILELMGLNKPDLMSGTSLLKKGV